MDSPFNIEHHVLDCDLQLSKMARPEKTTMISKQTLVIILIHDRLSMVNSNSDLETQCAMNRALNRELICL